MTLSTLESSTGTLAIRYGTGTTSLGSIAVAVTSRGVCAIEFVDSDDVAARLRERFPEARITPADDGLAPLVNEVVACIEQPERGLDLSLDIGGTAFQQRVWGALRDIPRGETLTYAQLAERIGRPQAARAIAAACAANRIAVAIPCHRVVQSDGSLGGYRWGVERKRELLAREGANNAAPGS